jgi:hypothetical protein
MERKPNNNMFSRIWIQILIGLVLALSSGALPAQVFGFAEIETIPSSPTVADSIFIRTRAVTTTGAQFNYSVEVGADTIRIESCFGVGGLFGIDTWIDTTNIGLLPAGSYVIIAVAYTSGTVNFCTPVDSVFSDSSFEVSFTTGLEDLQAGFNIYPIPMMDRLFVQVPEGSSSRVRILMKNMLGQVMIDRQLGHDTVVDVSALAAGTYIVSVHTEPAVLMRKVLKQ